MSAGHIGDITDIEQVDTRAEFGALLTALRRASGRSLRDLAAEIGSSASTLSGWCRAERLPFASQHPVFSDLLHALGVADPEPWLAAMERVRDPRGATGLDVRCPYPGLASFGPDDVERFFGRSALIERTLTSCRAAARATGGTGLVTLVGASGSGKSSLLHAGVLPRLASDGTPIVALRPGADPLARLAMALSDHLGAEEIRDELLHVAPSAWPGIVTACAGPSGTPLVVVDQLEELFTECRDTTARADFLTALLALVTPGAASTNGGDAVVRPAVATGLLSLRSDFFGTFVADGRLTAALQESQVLVGPLEEAELREAIVGPARAVGVSVDDELVATLVRDFVPAGAVGGRHDVGALPLLSHALAATWAHASQGRLTVADYHAAGGIVGAVERSAERIHAELAPEQQELARQVLLRLVNLDAEIATRRTAPIHELTGLDHASDGDAVHDLLGRFVAARLLTAHDDGVTIAHEALLGAWPRLRGWIEADREALRGFRIVAEATRQWRDAGEEQELLATGARLEAMLAHAEAAGSLATATDERRFLTAATARRDEAARVAARGARRLRVFAAVAASFALVAGIAGVTALDARSEAITARNEALSRQMALTADRLAETDGNLAAQLALAGYRVAPTSEARSALVDVSARGFGTRLLGGTGSTALAVAGNGGLSAVSDATAGTVRVVSQDHEVLATIELAGEGREVYALAFDPPGQLLAIGDTGADISLYDVSDPSSPALLGAPLTGPDGPIQGLAVSPDGSELSAVGLGDGVFRWDITDPDATSRLPTLPAEEITWSVAYLPGGEHVVFGDELGRVHLWALGDGSEEPGAVAVFDPGDGRSMLSVAVSPDGSVLTAGSRSGTMHAWALPVGQDLVQLPETALVALADQGTLPADPELVGATPLEVPDVTFASWVNAVSFSPDGARVAAGSSDGAVRIWDVASWEVIAELTHPTAVTEARFSADGEELATTATDGTMRVWSLAGQLPTTLAGRIWGLDVVAGGGGEVSDRGSLLTAFSGADTGRFTVGADGVATERSARLPSPPDGPSFSGGGAASPSGRLLAHGTLTGEVLLYEMSAAGRAQPVGTPLGGSTDLVETLAFNPSEDLLVAGGVDTRVRVWDVTDPAAPVALPSLEDPEQIVLGTAFSPTAPLLAVASADASVYLYDLADPRRPVLVATLDGFDAEAYGVAFRGDGEVLAISGTDRIVQLWDVRDPAAPRRIGEPLTGPVSRVYALDFAPDGGLLAAAVTDGTAWVWDVSGLESDGDRSTVTRHAVLGPVEGPLYTIAFAADGGTLVAAGGGSRLHTWPLDTAALTASVCEAVGDPLTADEWAIYLPERTFEPPCG